MGWINEKINANKSRDTASLKSYQVFSYNFHRTRMATISGLYWVCCITGFVTFWVFCSANYSIVSQYKSTLNYIFCTNETYETFGLNTC